MRVTGYAELVAHMRESSTLTRQLAQVGQERDAVWNALVNLIAALRAAHAAGMVDLDAVTPAILAAEKAAGLEP